MNRDMTDRVLAVAESWMGWLHARIAAWRTSRSRVTAHAPVGMGQQPRFFSEDNHTAYVGFAGNYSGASSVITDEIRQATPAYAGSHVATVNFRDSQRPTVRYQHEAPSSLPEIEAYVDGVRVGHAVVDHRPVLVGRQDPQHPDVRVQLPADNLVTISRRACQVERLGDGQVRVTVLNRNGAEYEDQTQKRVFELQQSTIVVLKADDRLFLDPEHRCWLQLRSAAPGLSPVHDAAMGSNPS